MAKVDGVDMFIVMPNIKCVFALELQPFFDGKIHI